MRYLLANPGLVTAYFLEHLYLTVLALSAAAAIALPLAWILFGKERLTAAVLGVLGVLYTVPSIGMIILLLPVFGLNKTSVLVALILYSQVLLVRNTLAGLEAINPAVREAAVGMGMGRLRLAWEVELPLALPVILAGVRLAAVVSISIATVGAKFGSGGLGVLLFEGIAQSRVDKLWVGTALIAILALGVYFGLKSLEDHLHLSWGERSRTGKRITF